MSAGPPVENEFDKSSVSIESFLLILLAVTVGLIAAILVLPAWLPNMANSLAGESPKVYWYLSRATAFVSLTVLWLSMALGLGISNKMARLWPGAPAAFAIHEYVSLLGLAFALFHALVLLGDHYINFTISQIFMPFSTVDYRPVWVGVGQIGFYVWLIVALSFYVRSLIGQKTWRVLHYLSFAMYIMGLLHGLFSGTDSTASWAQQYYWISGGSLLFLFVYRLINTVAEKQARRLKSKPVPEIQHPLSTPQPRPMGLQQFATPQNKLATQAQPTTPQQKAIPQAQRASSHPQPTQPQEG